MGNSRNTGYLQNAIKVSDTGAITFVSGSTTLMSISNTGAVSSSATTVSSSVDNLVVNNNAVLGSSESSTVSIPAFISSDLYPIADTYKLGSPANYWTRAYVQTGSFNEINVTGRITAQTLVVQTITSSVDFVTGSTRFGSVIGNTHVFTGSMAISGGLVVSSTSPELTVSATGVTLGNAITDVHTITGSVNVSGSATFVSSITANGGTMSLGNDGTYGSTYKTLGLTGNSDGSHRIFAGTADDIYIAAATARGIYFWTNGVTSTRMRILPNGDIGIGTSSPVAADVSSRTLQLLNTVILQNVVGNQALFSNNAYYDGTWKRATTLGSAAIRMNADSGQTGISFHVAASGTAGGGISTWDTTDIKMRINENGNVGIGSMTPGSKLYVVGTSGDVTSDTGNGTVIEIYGGNITSTNNGIGIGFTREGSQLGYIKAARENTSNEASFMIFSTQTSTGAHPERMRITSGGQTNFKHNTNDLDVVTLQNQSSSPYGMNITYTAVSPNNGSNNFLYFADSTTLRFAARSNGGLSNYSGNNINLASDRRLKKDISPLLSEWDKLKQIEVVNFRYKDSSEETTLYGAIAQQVQEVYPELVIVTREATEIEPEYYGLREQPFQWLTTKVLQEAMAKIEELKAENDTLKEILQRNNIQ